MTTWNRRLDKAFRKCGIIINSILWKSVDLTLLFVAGGKSEERLYTKNYQMNEKKL